MEFLNKNLIDTTTSVTVGSSSNLISNIMIRDLRWEYITDGVTAEPVAGLFRVDFASTQTVSRIAIMGINWKRFTISYDDTITNTFNLTSTGATTVSDFTTNSETSLYLRATPQACTSVSFNAFSTQVANQEKSVGYILISNVLSDLGGRNPEVGRYLQLRNRKQRVHRLASGGVNAQVFDRRRSADLRLDNVNASTTTQLLSVFELREDFVFAPFGTTTSWDEMIFPCVWENGFDFHTYTDNATAVNTSGRIGLLETRPG